ncbi:hypothetical protein Efla_005318 [Eimeria flavescens]
MSRRTPRISQISPFPFSDKNPHSGVQAGRQITGNTAASVSSTSATRFRGRKQRHSVGSRAFSSAVVGGLSGSRLHPSKGLSSCSGTGVSDEETCATSDAGVQSQSQLFRIGSCSDSRRPSADSFEDALECMGREEGGPLFQGVDSCYSSFAFSLRGLGAGSSREDEPRASTARQPPQAEVRDLPPFLTSRQLDRPARLPRSQRSYAPAASLGRQAEEGSRGEDRQQQQDASSAAALAVSSPRGGGETAAAAVAAAADDKGQQTRSSRQARKEQRPLSPRGLPRSATRDPSLVGRKKPAISRYASVPAFSAADQLRIDRFKAGLPRSLSTQEALRQQREGQLERQREEPLLDGQQSLLEMSSDLGHPVDWRSLLNAAGLGDVAHGEIALEAEELQAKIDQRVSCPMHAGGLSSDPRGPPRSDL